MKRIVLKHLSGSKANQVEEFPLNHFEELVIGRDPSATVKFDPDKDDLVGRQHAKIMRDGPDSPQFMIKDLGSRNGTYLNKERIIGAANIAPGDIVQFGPGGPEFQFDIEPRPEGFAPPTRVAPGATAATAVKQSGPPATRVSDSLAGASAAAGGSNGGRTAVGKATVMRMVSQSKSESRRNIAIVASVLLLLVAVGIAGTVWWTHKRTQNQPVVVVPPAPAAAPAKDTMSPSEIAAAYTGSTVFIQHSWNLINTKNGLPLFFKFFQNAYKDKKDGKAKYIVDDKRPWVAAYKVISANGGQTIEPYLTTDSTGGVLPVGYSATGSGFVVTGDGFILTNKHVAETWKIPHHFFGDREYLQLFLPGILYRCDTQGNCENSPIADETGKPQLVTDPNMVAGWIPAGTIQFGYSQLGSSPVTGRNESLYITFPNTENRIPAGDVRSSDRHDVAIMKINVASPLKPVELNDNYDTIKPGDGAIVLGYPGGSPPQIAIITSKAMPGAAQESQLGIVPNATLSVGNISRILREQEGTQGRDAIKSTYGDVYQLTINSTGHGNSGGPVFDDHGKVIAVYTYLVGDPSDFMASAAVPIRFAKELMGVTPIVNK